MQTPKVSIILTSYNKPKFVGKVIESVLNQTMGNFELFIMDDNSNQMTQKAIQPYLSDDRVKFYRSNVKDEDRHKTIRYAVLINQALSMAKGDYISYLTDDNLYNHERLNIMSSYLDQHSDINVVYSAQILITLDSDLQPKRSRIRRTCGVLSTASGLVDHCSVMHRRSILKAIRKKYSDFWNVDPKFWGYGDGVFWDRINEKDMFYPIDKVLDYNIRTPFSYQVKLGEGIPGFIPDCTLLKGTDPFIYYIENRKRRPIKDVSTFKFMKFNRKNIVEIPDPELFKFPLGEIIDKDKLMANIPNNLLIGSYDSYPIYLMQGGFKRKIPDEKTFEDYGYQLESVVFLAQHFIDSIQNGPELSSKITRGMLLPNRVIFKSSGVYYVSNDNCLHPIGNNNIHEKLCLPIHKAIDVSTDVLNYYPIGEKIMWQI